MPDPAPDVARHYGRPGLGGLILQALRAAGLDPDALAPGDLAPLEHFHTRGLEATLELLRLAAIARGARVLDVGGGLGGPARVLAREADVRVTVIDLTEEYCRVGEDLTRRVGLADRIGFRVGDALAMPFADGAFDAAWTQHSSMNVPDKVGLYREIHRVLRPGGRLAMHEILAGPNEPIHFPVPWARHPAISHLGAPDGVRRTLLGLGFREATWRDQSAASLQWFRERVAAGGGAGAAPPVGVSLLLGPDFPAMFGNMVRNLEEDRIRIVMGVWDRA